MILFPAIDLKSGQVVRLAAGDMKRVTVYSEDPAAQAQSFESAGFNWLHLVDLDGAVSGRSVNGSAVEAILNRVAIPVQLGGGIRDMGAIEQWLSRGVRRVILGTAAVRNPPLVRAAARRYPGRIAIGVDARKGTVAVEGWAEAAEISVVELAKRFEDVGVAALIHTDIARDGLLTGLDLEATRRLAEAVSVPVIASGGLASLDDVRALLAPENRVIEGAVVGRALYDGRLDPAAALRLVKEEKAAVRA